MVAPCPWTLGKPLIDLRLKPTHGSCTGLQRPRETPVVHFAIKGGGRQAASLLYFDAAEKSFRWNLGHVVTSMGVVPRVCRKFPSVVFRDGENCAALACKTRDLWRCRSGK